MLITSTTTKRCTECKLELDVSKFYKRTVSYDGKDNKCKDCKAKYIKAKGYRKSEKTKAKIRNWYKENKTLAREIAMKRKYGVTYEEYQSQITKQGGKCPLCFGELIGAWREPPIDHCHTTGKVRGVLCHGCNTSLHKLEKDISWADRAKAYIEAEGVW